jgi:hypothetical protein
MHRLSAWQSLREAVIFIFERALRGAHLHAACTFLMNMEQCLTSSCSSDHFIGMSAISKTCEVQAPRIQKRDAVAPPLYKHDRLRSKIYCPNIVDKRSLQLQQIVIAGSVLG